MRRESNSSKLCWLASRLLLTHGRLEFFVLAKRIVGSGSKIVCSEDWQKNLSWISVIVNDETARHSLQKALQEKRKDIILQTSLALILGANFIALK